MNKLPVTYRLTQHSVSKRWRIERRKLGYEWRAIGGEDHKVYLFKWYAKIVMYNMIAAEIERVTYENGTWEEQL